jgi:hypothetical protein
VIGYAFLTVAIAGSMVFGPWVALPSLAILALVAHHEAKANADA